MRKILLLVLLVVMLLAGCRTVEPVVVDRIIAPDLSVFRYDVYALFPLIGEPQTDADLMYNQLVVEMDAALQTKFGDMVLEYNRILIDQLGK